MAPVPLAFLAARLGWVGAPATIPVAPRPPLTWLGAAGVLLIWLSYGLSFVWAPPATPGLIPGLIAALVEALPTFALLAVFAALLVVDAPRRVSPQRTPRFAKVRKVLVLSPLRNFCVTLRPPLRSLRFILPPFAQLCVLLCVLCGSCGRVFGHVASAVGGAHSGIH